MPETSNLVWRYPPIKEVKKKSCSINNSWDHGYLMTSSQIVKIEKTSCNFEELFLLNKKRF